MRDLNLGPDTRELVKNYRILAKGKQSNGCDPVIMAASEMALMLERWMEVAWCWVDASPARLCGGPHVKVRYTNSKLIEVIEPLNKVGETFPDVPYTVIQG